MTKTKITQKEAKAHGINMSHLKEYNVFYRLENGDIVDQDGNIRYENKTKTTLPLENQEMYERFEISDKLYKLIQLSEDGEIALAEFTERLEEITKEAKEKLNNIIIN